jgi:hypothetical protein
MAYKACYRRACFMMLAIADVQHETEAIMLRVYLKVQLQAQWVLARYLANGNAIAPVSF